jgi:hypothetical protein
MSSNNTRTFSKVLDILISLGPSAKKSSNNTRTFSKVLNILISLGPSAKKSSSNTQTQALLFPLKVHIETRRRGKQARYKSCS